MQIAHDSHKISVYRNIDSLQNRWVFNLLDLGSSTFGIMIVLTPT